MKFADSFFKEMEPAMHEALLEMSGLEGGSIANLDENRMVGHYWLRDPALAPSRILRDEIESTIDTIHIFCNKIHSGALKSERENHCPQQRKAPAENTMCFRFGFFQRTVMLANAMFSASCGLMKNCRAGIQ